MGEGHLPRRSGGAPRRDRGVEPSLRRGRADAREHPQGAGRGGGGPPERLAPAAARPARYPHQKRSMTVRPDDIAIIGMGCLFPGATSLEEYWQNIKDGVDCITEIPATHWRPDDYFDPDKKAPDRTYARRGGFLSPYPFNPLAFGIAPHTIEATDTSQLLGMVVAQQALEDAGYGQK